MHSARQRYTIKVVDGNEAPRLVNLVTTYTIFEGQRLAIDVTATDADGDAILSGAQNLPPGATFNSARRVFDWTPGFDAAGTYDGIILVVSDGLEETVQPISVLVRPAAERELIAADLFRAARVRGRTF